MTLRNRYPNTGTLTVSGNNGTLNTQIHLGVQSLRKSFPNDNPIVMQQQFWDAVTPTTGVLNFYNGSAWVEGVVKYYNGSSWSNATPRYWNGTTWIPSLVTAAYCTTLAAGGTAAFTVPAMGTGSITIWGWVYIPSTTSDLQIGFTEHCMLVQYSYGLYINDWYANWTSFQADHFLLPGWNFIATTYNSTTFSFRTRHIESRYIASYIMAQGNLNTYDGNDTTGRFGRSENTLALTYGYGGVVQAALTDAQLLAQSNTSSPLNSPYSFWTMENASGADSIGTNTLTLTGATTATISLLPGQPTLDTTKSTMFPDFAGYGGSPGYFDVSGCPLNTTGSMTIGFWCKLLAGVSSNSYIVRVSNSDNTDEIAFVVQNYGTDSTVWNSNISFFWDGSFVTDYCGQNLDTGSLTIPYTWNYVVFTLQISGGATNCASYWMTDGGTISSMVTDTIPSTYDTSTLTKLRIGTSIGEICHVKLFNSILTTAQMQTAATSSANDTSAFTHVPLLDASCVDVSGNNRTVSAFGTLRSGLGGSLPSDLT